jgi:hypothetical protein
MMNQKVILTDELPEVMTQKLKVDIFCLGPELETYGLDENRRDETSAGQTLVRFSEAL